MKDKKYLEDKEVKEKMTINDYKKVFRKYFNLEYSNDQSNNLAWIKATNIKDSRFTIEFDFWSSDTFVAIATTKGYTDYSSFGKIKNLEINSREMIIKDERKSYVFDLLKKYWI